MQLTEDVEKYCNKYIIYQICTAPKIQHNKDAANFELFLG